MNTWNSVGHKAGDEDKEDSDAISVVVIGATNQQDEDGGSEDDDPGVNILLEES
jgi:hypothetical protein